MTRRKYEILSNLEEIGKDWTVFGGENKVLFPISEKFFPIWRKLERIGDLITGEERADHRVGERRSLSRKRFSVMRCVNSCK